MITLSSLVHLPQHEQKERGLLYTPREIMQQPETWQGTLELFQQAQERISRFLEEAGLRKPVEQRPAIVLIGAGTSDYAGGTLALLLKQMCGCEVTTCASTELLPNITDHVVAGKRYLWISFSRSGDSPEGVALLQQATASYPEIAQLVVTCNAESRMAAICRKHAHAEILVLSDAVNDRSLAMTSSFTNMVIMGQCLAHTWSLDSYLPVLRQLRVAGEFMLEQGFPLAETLASRRMPRVCMVGSGPLAAVAKESALKVLEMSAGQVKTMAETTLGLRHGPMAALDDETLFICFVSGDVRRQGYAADLLREVGTKGITAARIAIGPESAKELISPVCEKYLTLGAEVADNYRPVVDVLFGQMLGLCTSIEHGLQPDAPSPGGVISRVVQDFAIYR